jgi:hypothetical protein
MKLTIFGCYEVDVIVVLKNVILQYVENKDFCFALFHFGFSISIPNFFINFASGFV